MRVSALCLLISATFTRLFNAFQFNRSSWAVPELYELIQGVPLSERGWKNSPVPTAGTNPSARPPHQSKVLGGERERAGKGKPFFRRVPLPNIHLNHHIGHLVLGFEAFLFRTHVADVALDLAQYFDIDAFAVVTPEIGRASWRERV